MSKNYRQQLSGHVVRSTQHKRLVTLSRQVAYGIFIDEKCFDKGFLGLILEN